MKRIIMIILIILLIFAALATVLVFYCTRNEDEVCQYIDRALVRRAEKTVTRYYEEHEAELTAAAEAMLAYTDETWEVEYKNGECRLYCPMDNKEASLDAPDVTEALSHIDEDIFGWIGTVNGPRMIDNEHAQIAYFSISAKAEGFWLRFYEEQGINSHGIIADVELCYCAEPDVEFGEYWSVDRLSSNWFLYREWHE